MTTATKWTWPNGIKPRSVHIHGKRWFEKVNGNTYFSVCVFVDGVQVHHTDYEYGYGSQYEQRAMDELARLGYCPPNTYPARPWFADHDINVVNIVTDVARKRDL